MISFCAQRTRCCARVVLALALALPGLLSYAAPPGPAPIRYPHWGSTDYGVPYEFDSFDDLVGARMPVVVSTQSPGAYPKSTAHPGENCDNNDLVTGLTTFEIGLICSEAKNSYACNIPGIDPPYYWSYCQVGQGVSLCPKVYDWDGAQCVVNGNHDPQKKCTSCSVTGNPIQIGLTTKFESELDYSSPGGLRFERTYLSAGRGRWAALGELWRHNYARSITLVSGQGTQMALVRRADGTLYEFVLSAGAWASEADVDDRLSEIIDAGGARVGWTYVSLPSDETETYDVNGRLIAIADRAGVTQTLAYDSAGRLHSVRDAFGRSLTFGYDVVNRITSMTDPAGNAYAYGYDSTNRLVSVAYPDATARLYHYENPSYPLALTGITDENANRYASFAYDSQGRAVETKHLLEGAVAVERYALSYPSSSSAIVTDPLGTARTYGFSTILRVRKQTTLSQPCTGCGGLSDAARSYDANGNLASRTDFNGNRTNYAYDLDRNLETRRVEGLSAAGDATPATRTITTQWHPAFRLPIAIAEPKRITSYAYDTHGNVSSKSIQPTSDASGAQGLSASALGSARSWTYTNTYSSTIPGFLVQQVVDGPRTDIADITTYQWDDSGNLSTITNALGHTTTLSDYDAHGRPQQISDPNALTSTLAYDVRGRLISRNVEGELISYTYDAAGQLTRITLPDGSFLIYSYDAAHRLTQILDSLGNKLVYTLDAMGNRIQEQVFDPNQALVQKRSREFDALNRLSKDIGGANPAAQITQYAYDTQGNITSITDPLGHITTNAYDALNRILQVIDPAAYGASGGGSTQYAYDGLDRVIQVRDARALATGYTIDGLGNLTRLTSPDTGITSSAYDAAGNLTSQIDPRGVMASFSYDELNRLTQATYTPPAGSITPPVTISYSYDRAAVKVSHERGRLTDISDPSGSSTYTHDLHGRVIEETRVISGIAYTTSYSYDSGGRLVRITYPSGRTVDYGFDGLGRIAQIDTSYAGVSEPVVTNVVYQPFGPVKSFTYGNASGARRSFDQDGRMESYTLGAITRTLSYDNASRIVAFNHSGAAPDQSFLYDNLDRLVNWSTANTNQSFGYDVVGNRTSQTIGTSSYPYTYSALSNQLTAVAGPAPASYQYDPAGSIVSAGQASFTYDARHRLVQSAVGAQRASYQVNALGQRVTKTLSNGATTVYHYDLDGHLIAESDAVGNVQIEYIYLGEIPVAVLQ